MAGLRTSSSPLIDKKRPAPATAKPFVPALRAQRNTAAADAVETIQNQIDAVFGVLRNDIPSLNELLITDETGKMIGWIGVRNSGTGLRRGGWFAEGYFGGSSPDDAPLWIDASGNVIVGGKNTGTPYISIKDDAGVEIGRIGAEIDTGFDGAWFKSLRIGGADLAHPVVTADSSGNVTIDGATLQLDSNGLVTKIANETATGGVNGVSVYSSNLGAAALIRPSQIIIAPTTAGATQHVLLDGGSNGFLHLADTNGNVKIAVYATSGGGSGGIDLINAAGAIMVRFSGTGVTIGGNSVLGARQDAVGDANTAHATASFADVNTALNALGTKINTILDRVGPAGHGLTAD